ncbi:uncharacterized protein LOC119798720 [Cyprinodon tularosa]|uniref:uncharacterized protein LOC119798720 n=1 Tax=Cyprinodon tularosa TaxID=77115 RepID=UPI0018E28DD9|nr:uncharacterized protein LOC119798720 [Cyprinodon tularosa]
MDSGGRSWKYNPTAGLSSHPLPQRCSVLTASPSQSRSWRSSAPPGATGRKKKNPAGWKILHPIREEAGFLREEIRTRRAGHKQQFNPRRCSKFSAQRRGAAWAPRGGGSRRRELLPGSRREASSRCRQRTGPAAPGSGAEVLIQRRLMRSCWSQSDGDAHSEARLRRHPVAPCTRWPPCTLVGSLSRGVFEQLAVTTLGPECLSVLGRLPVLLDTWTFSPWKEIPSSY